ncbi:HSF-type DNA-binding-domain-containing protein [Cokeromyces recurvatus]|uniref:HSF-type DNA-binding-domain-containing protein n=1 Tax=Cokeromyces recurvatus TaxID=90255 RepID=UPI00221E3DC6|nr:HSF-type DNA-binding-domain-containing protein [Cokeromyces recurvatus]KAI7905258.1 HSF-type DNA-binding-domain-containing protein [Cokeromyces recurvatus]
MSTRKSITKGSGEIVRANPNQFTFNNDDQFQYTIQDDIFKSAAVAAATTTTTTEECCDTWSHHDLSTTANQTDHAIAGFILKLYKYLQTQDDEQKYVRWSNFNGVDMFIIDCISKFTEIVLPKVFKHCKFASFVRQLNIYGFRRDSDGRKSKDMKGKDSCRWYHSYFRPERRDLLHLIRRKSPRHSRTTKKTVVVVEKRTDRKEQNSPEWIDGLSGNDSFPITTSSSSPHSRHFEEDHDGINDETREPSSNIAPSYSSSSVSTTNMDYHDDHDLVQFTFQNSLKLKEEEYDDNQTLSSYFKENATNFSRKTPVFDLPINNNNIIFVPPPPTSTPVMETESKFKHFYSSLISREQEEENIPIDTKIWLQKEFIQLQETYSSMCKTLTGEVTKAYEIIESQKLRIEYLDNLLLFLQQQQQQQQQQQSPQLSVSSQHNSTFIQQQEPIFYENKSTNFLMTEYDDDNNNRAYNIFMHNDNLMINHRYFPRDPNQELAQNNLFFF